MLGYPALDIIGEAPARPGKKTRKFPIYLPLT